MTRYRAVRGALMVVGRSTRARRVRALGVVSTLLVVAVLGAQPAGADDTFGTPLPQPVSQAEFRAAGALVKQRA